MLRFNNDVIFKLAIKSAKMFIVFRFFLPILLNLIDHRSLSKFGLFNESSEICKILMVFNLWPKTNDHH